MSRNYEDFHELILTGYAANLSPEDIHARFISGGLPPDTVPPIHTIRVIGCALVGPGCRWRSQGRMTSWSSGVAVKGHTDQLQFLRKGVR